MLVKRAFRYRFYPTKGQAAQLSRTFGCVRLVYNKALEARTMAWNKQQRRVGYAESSTLLTGWKHTQELAFLNEVSSVPLQQCLRHLHKAFTSFFDNRIVEFVSNLLLSSALWALLAVAVYAIYNLIVSH